ncbi:MAG TPA: hypothetical protein VG986_07410 [Pseudolabrys sp.]|nr:hypothetical protein [Pseudolabrys sp.]
MRYTKLAAAVLAAAVVMPVMAEKKQASAAPAPTGLEASASAPTWHDCFYLAWIRGVHVEQQELPAFMEQCMASAVPFGDDYQKYVKDTGH